MATSKIGKIDGKPILSYKSSKQTTDGTSWEEVLTFTSPEYGSLMGVAVLWNSGKPTGVKVLVDGRANPLYERTLDGQTFTGFFPLTISSGSTIRIQSTIATASGTKQINCWVIQS